MFKTPPLMAKTDLVFGSPLLSLSKHSLVSPSDAINDTLDDSQIKKISKGKSYFIEVKEDFGNLTLITLNQSSSQHLEKSHDISKHSRKNNAKTDPKKVERALSSSDHFSKLIMISD